MIPRIAKLVRIEPSRAAFVAGILAVAVLQIALIASHDYFVDEWQALQIAVQSPDISALLANLRYEGHPPLWYLLLRGLARIAGPAHALMAASLLCALTTIVLVARAPMSRLARLAIVLSEPILFEYGTVSRGYSLGVALTFVCLALWDRRRGFWLVLALLPLVDFLFGLIALGLIALRYGEGRKIWPIGLGIFSLAAVLAAWSVIPAADFVSVYRPTGALEALVRWVMELAVVTLPVQWSGGPQWDAIWMTPATPVLGLLFLLIIVDQTRDTAWERVVALGFPFALLAFMVMVHILAIRHVLLAALVLVAVLWRQGARGAPIRWPAASWLGVSAACGLGTAAFALTVPFDTAPQVARTIRSLELADESWMAFPAQHGQGVSALSGIVFEGAELGCRQHFIRWNFRHRLTGPHLLRDWLSRESAQGGTFYLLSQHQPAPGKPIHHLATVAPGLDGKIYYLYRVDGAERGRRLWPAFCVEGTKALPPLMDD